MTNLSVACVTNRSNGWAVRCGSLTDARSNDHTEMQIIFGCW